MLEDKQYVEAILGENPECLQFNKKHISAAKNQDVFDYVFEDGTVIRATFEYDAPEQPPDLPVWTPLKNCSLVFVKHPTKKGKDLKP